MEGQAHASQYVHAKRKEKDYASQASVNNIIWRRKTDGDGSGSRENNTDVGLQEGKDFSQVRTAYLPRRGGDPSRAWDSLITLKRIPWGKRYAEEVGGGPVRNFFTKAGGSHHHSQKKSRQKRFDFSP